MDSIAYEKHLKEKFVKHDLLCNRCGGCCGTNDDPCLNLVSEESGKYKCRIYEMRFGPQGTVSGKVFNCVPIKDNIEHGFSDTNCAYAQL